MKAQSNAFGPGDKSGMKTIILTMHEEWWNLIASGVKTLEIRTTKPRCEFPVRVLVYVTKGKGIVGEFICNSVDQVVDYEMVSRKSRVSAWGLYQYSKGGRRKVYAWGVSDVKVYDRPIALKSRPPQSWCYVKNEDEIGGSNS